MVQYPIGKNASLDIDRVRVYLKQTRTKQSAQTYKKCGRNCSSYSLDFIHFRSILDIIEFIIRVLNEHSFQ